MYKRLIKRGMDVLFSAVAILVLALPMLIIAAAVRLDGAGPVLFRQSRVGKDGKPFTILKFRTMRIDAPSETPALLMENAKEWTTGVGAFLRKTSLDELPQLFNILAGQMSFVGPRPVIASESELTEARRQNGAVGLTPGLTGWAQIHGRNRLSAAEKAAYDGEYLQKISFFFDLRCILGTFGALFEKSDGK